MKKLLVLTLLILLAVPASACQVKGAKLTKVSNALGYANRQPEDQSLTRTQYVTKKMRDWLKSKVHRYDRQEAQVVVNKDTDLFSN